MEYKMIARIWHSMTRAEKADEYVDYLNKTGLPDYRATKGNSGAYILRKIEGDTAHFYTLTFWDSVGSIKEFAGENHVRARYYPEDEKFLLEFEETVEHFEVFG
jgi:heme-degrading monooxygenase HmoA